MSKKNIPLWISGGILALAVLVTAAFWCTRFSRMVIPVLMIAQAILFYAYPLCAAVFISKKGLKVGLITIAITCAADYLLGAFSSPLSLVVREQYFSFFNACKDSDEGLAVALSAFIKGRYHIYLLLFLSITVFYMFSTVLKRRPFFTAKRCGRYCGAALCSFVTLTVFDIGSTISSGGVARYTNFIVIGIFIIAWIAGTFLFFWLTKPEVGGAISNEN